LTDARALTLQELMVTSVTKAGGTQKLPKGIKSPLLKPTDMTIHWKALEEHFLMVPLVFRFTHFRGEMHFLNFSISVLTELSQVCVKSSNPGSDNLTWL
jgi:hypothetical protein